MCAIHVIVRCIERNPSDVSGYHVQATTCSCFITTPVSISIWQPLALRISGYQDIRPGKYEEIGGMRLWGYQTIMRSGEYEKIMKWREFGPKWHRSPKLGQTNILVNLAEFVAQKDILKMWETDLVCNMLYIKIYKRTILYSRRMRVHWDISCYSIRRSCQLNRSLRSLPLDHLHKTPPHWHKIFNAHFEHA